MSAFSSVNFIPETTGQISIKYESGVYIKHFQRVFQFWFILIKCKPYEAKIQLFQKHLIA